LIGEEISSKTSLLERVDQLASRVVKDCDDIHSIHIKQSMDCLHQLRDEVLLHHHRLVEELETAAHLGVM